MSAASPKEVLERHRASIMKIAGVVGVGFGLSPTEPGQKRILVYTTGSDWPAGLPRQIEGYAVETLRRKKGFHAL